MTSQGKQKKDTPEKFHGDNFAHLYNNPNGADLIIRYGSDGGYSFVGHEIVFAKSTERSSAKNFLGYHKGCEPVPKVRRIGGNTTTDTGGEYRTLADHLSQSPFHGDITLHGDDPRALESMFEFAYFDRYTDPFHFQAPTREPSSFPTGRNLSPLINHHIRVLAIAHKYRIRTLQACALAKLDILLTAGEHEYWDPGRWNTEVLGYLVK